MIQGIHLKKEKDEKVPMRDWQWLVMEGKTHLNKHALFISMHSFKKKPVAPFFLPHSMLASSHAQSMVFKLKKKDLIEVLDMVCKVEIESQVLGLHCWLSGD